MRHRLTAATRSDDVTEITDSLVALHSSDPASVYMSAMARMRHPSIEAVDAALYEDRSVIRHHAMRRTLWVMTPETARLAHASSTAALAPKEWKSFAKLVEASEVADDGAAWLREARSEALDTLHRLGVDDPMGTTARALGQAAPALRAPLYLSVGKPYAGTQSAHTRLLLMLGFEGEAVRTKPMGSWVSGEYRWAAMDRWLPGGVAGADPSVAGAGMVDRWLRAFGPGSTADVQWWMGWTLGTTRAALASAGAEEIELEHGTGWVASGDAASPDSHEPWVALLPGLDPTTMGWKQRDWYLAPEVAAQVFDRNGNGGPTIWVDGEIVGSWAQRKDGTIALAVLTDVGAERRAAIDAAAHHLETLIGSARVTVRFPAPIQRSLLA